jgi:hypothetical protein
MRALIVLAALCIAGPAAAQPYLGMVQAREAQASADALAQRNRDIAITNELAVLQARAQSDQALSNLAAARIAPTLPTILPPAARSADAPPAIVDTTKQVSIPDALLADSNARVRAAADNRR